MSASQTTTDHGKIRDWVKARNGRPARVKGAKKGGILRIDFGKPEETLEEISWEEFFRIFDENDLAFLYQEKTESGDTSRFTKFVNRQ
ncbi:hypothetical protein [Rhizobium leucaenae]|uniref:1,4-alpha-glucan branching enzyme n=1 Tax=Rhizobium leucaenae TaxID=29450 RepID=A0A7W7EIV4_9HYPH|nr:hypothetical protein [Rhizobium leucaenae]MBB4566789.1 hypothetical protein [Rhizobium leucaenae]MBB6300597.1 hypothetical protein [Rhizobium leucaenae]